MHGRRMRWILAIFFLLGLFGLTACNSSSGTPAIIDTDGDGVANTSDNCLLIPNTDQADADQNGVGDVCEGDTDGDGILDATDNCPLISNPGQEDTNIDGIGDVCSVDTDVDGIFDFLDNCPADANTNQADGDNDGVGNVCDNCPATANADQADADGDGTGDVCDVTPTPVADTFNWIGNTTLTIAAPGLLGNDPAGIITITDPGARDTTEGGRVTVNADGSFTYEPLIGAQNVPDTFTYSAGGLTTTVTVNLAEPVWYVDNRLGGPNPDGSNDAPFTSLAAVVGDDLDDTIFVFTGDGLNTGQDAGITLLPGQKLIGQGVGLSVNGLLVVPATALAPVLADTVTTVGGQAILTLSSGNEVAGITIDGTGAQANLVGIAGNGISGFNIHDNLIQNLNREGLLLSGASGGIGIFSNNVLNNLATGGNGVDIITTAAGVDLLLSGNTLTDVAQTGIRIQFNAGGGNLTISNNDLTANVGTDAGRRGIDVDASGTSALISRISDNQIGSIATTQIGRSGLQVNATVSGQHSASLQNNIIVNAGADGSDGIEVQADVAASSMCLQMSGNNSDSGITLDNRNGGTLQAEGPAQVDLEAANTGVFAYLNLPTDISFVPVGICFPVQ